VNGNARPTLCYVTDRQSLGVAAGADRGTALLERIRGASTAGVDWIELREKDLPARRLLELAASAVSATRAAGSARILVNDRLDVAWAAGAGGVHLGEASLPAGEVVESKRRRGPADFLVGVSCHSLEAARAAQDAAADYIFFGPVFTTPSKLAFGPPQGLVALGAVCSALRIPVLAIGGITAENAASCLEAGAAGIAGIRLFQQHRDLAALLETIR
jgi:thiamine-phosphate pyrophosphorylase